MQVPLYNPKTQQSKVQNFPCIFPDKLAAALLAESEELFQYVFFGKSLDPAEYWTHQLRHSKWFQRHPASERENFSQMIPLSLYGDEVQSFRNTEGGLVACIGWSSDFGAGLGPLSRYFLICAVPEHYTTKDTFKAIYSAVAARLSKMCDEHEVHPWTQYGYSFMYSSTQGDLKWLNDQFGFHNSRADEFCTMCSCVKYHPTDISMTLGDFRESARHKETRLDHEAWAANLDDMTPEEYHPIFSIPGSRADRLMHDVLHSQLLGTGKVTNGSVLTFLSEAGYFGPFRQPGFGKYDLCLEAVLKPAYGHWLDWKKAHGLSVNQPRFTVARLSRKGKTSYPSLSSKGAASKALSFWLGDCTREHAQRQDASSLDKLVATCMWSYCEVLRMLDEFPTVMSMDQANEFHRVGSLHLQTYGHLNGLSQKQQHVRQHNAENKALWQLLPKHHHMHHMVDEVRQSRINPSWYTLLCAESWIGYMGRISKTCHRSTLSLRTLQKYKLVLALHVQREMGSR